MPRGLLVGWASRDAEAARAAFDSARVHLESTARKAPNNDRVAIALAFAYAGLGRKADALREADRALTLMPMEKDAMQGPINARYAAEVYAQIGAHDKAMLLLQRLLTIPSRVTPMELRLNPWLDPLRSDARFKALSR